MATLIPALGACASRMTSGEKRLAELHQAIELQRVICSDEKTKSVPKASTQPAKPILILCYNEPLAVKLDSVMQTKGLADLPNAAHQEGHTWTDMAVLCRHHHEMDECAQALSRWQLPHQVRKGSGSFHPHEDSIKVMTMHASKGLEFPVVALMGVGQMPADGEDERDEARLFYVGGDEEVGDWG